MTMRYYLYVLLAVIVIVVLIGVTAYMRSRNERFDPGKHVIGCRNVGFFSNFFGVLNNIEYSYKTGKTPVVYWGPKDSLMYYDSHGYNGSLSDNIWEYYFAPVSRERYVPGDSIHSEYETPDGDGLVVTPDMYYSDVVKQHYHHMIRQHIRIKDEVMGKVERFCNENMRRLTVGIHLRGTDKHTEVKKVSVEQLCEAANRYSPCQFLVATDEQRLLDRAIDLLNGKVIYYDSIRSQDGTAIHLSNSSGAKAGEDVLVEALLLSRCHAFIHTMSNVSAAVVFFNPNIDNVLLHNGTA